MVAIIFSPTVVTEWDKRENYTFILHEYCMNNWHGVFRSLRNWKRRNKGNFTLKSISNKIMLCGSRGLHYLVLNKISTL